MQGWLRVQVDLGRRDPGPVERALLALGAESIELSDAGDQPILEPGPGQTPLWPEVRLRALLSPAVDELRVRLAVAAATAPGPLPAISFAALDERDWTAVWQQDLQPMRFGRRLWVCSGGQACPDPDGSVVRLDPGLAFGTGSHPTTALCLEFLDRFCGPGDTLLDFGCGSGILALAGLALGAVRATAVDNDPQALIAARRNAQHNSVSPRLEVCAPGDLEASTRFDCVVANILSGTLISLAPRLAAHCRAGGRLALSGILTEQAPGVRAAYAPWIDFDTPRTRDGWVLLAGRAVRRD